METVSKINCLNEQEDSDDAVAPPVPPKNKPVKGKVSNITRRRKPNHNNEDKEREKRWIESAKKGDVESFELLVGAYQQKVYNLSYRLLGDKEEAEDLVQEVFINVFRHLSRFRGDSQFSTWIYQVAMNHCRNRLKYLKRRFRHATESLDDPLHTKEGEVGRDFPDEKDVPEEAFYRRQVQNMVQSALRELREDYREVVALRDIQDLSYQEISEILNLPEGTIKSRLHRARFELKEVLVRLGVGQL